MFGTQENETHIRRKYPYRSAHFSEDTERYQQTESFCSLQIGICYFMFVVLLTLFFRINKPNTSTIGNTVATSNPVLRLPFAISERLPTMAGLTIAPKSPAKAKKANIAVPPLGQCLEDMLIEPGHIIPTPKPQSAQPASPRIGIAERDANK